jgi:Kdo2-lipid IVA lauroyltransferase/acyltransferase
MRQVFFRLEAALATAGLWLLGTLPPAVASNLGGFLARSIGPLLPVSRVADANLRMAMPELDAAARKRIVRGVWENLGRTVAELPHLSRLRETDSGPGWQVENRDVLQRIVAAGGQAVLVSGHFGNWEMIPPILHAHGIAVASFYRAAANPLVDEMIARLRRRAVGEARQMFPKGPDGARAAFAHLRGGGALGVLVDQKLNEGLSLPLFGLPAMTSPAAAAFALRLRCPLFFGHVERLGPARLRLVAGPQIPLPDSGDRNADIAAVTLAINQALEAAIRRRPDGWLWLHRRWPKDLYR